MPFNTDGLGFLSPQLQGLITLVMLAATLTLFYYIMIKTQPKKSEERYVTRTIVKCLKCGYEEKRDFKEGDFVGKIEGNCPKDDGTLVIRLIYSEKVVEQKS